MQLSTKHLLGIKDLQLSDIELILSTATQFKEVLQRPIKKVPSLRDTTIVNLFYENSTRTRISFELAEKRLSADHVEFFCLRFVCIKRRNFTGYRKQYLIYESRYGSDETQRQRSAAFFSKTYSCSYNKCRRWHQ